MSISLIKEREEKVKVTLGKKFKPEINIKAHVNFVIDVSGSMSGRFRSGTMQDVVERIFPIASVMDIDQELGIFVFDGSVKELKLCNIHNYSGYVTNEIINKGLIGGGTNYSPFISEIVNQNEGTETPVYNIVLTDGDNCDKDNTIRILKNSSGQKIFWQFVGIGNENFSFLQQLDDMKGRINDNADFFKVNEISDLSDEELYDRLLNEFPSFLENYEYGEINVDNNKKSWIQKILEFIFG